MEELKNEAINDHAANKPAEGPAAKDPDEGGSKAPAQAENEGFTPRRAIQDLCAIYLIYAIFTLIRSLRAGEVKEGHIIWVILAIVLFAAGIVWLLLPEIKKLFKKKES